MNGVARGTVYDLAKTGQRGLALVGWVFSSGESSEFLECCLHTREVREGVAFRPRADGEIWLPDVRPSGAAAGER